ncbi:MAG: FtsX-like permease family protein [Acidimicrobiia bacterium]|nr:FtsX-like permease family protein [Acidimicrobiia bacterium]
MTQLSVTSLWARRRRFASTAVAVVLGVAFLVGTLVLGDTLSANFDRLFSDVSAGTDVVVRNATVVEPDSGPGESRGPIDRSLVDVVEGVEGVATAEPQIVGYGSLLGRDGSAIGGNGPPRQAGSWLTTPELNPYRLVEGRAPQAPDEVVVNRGAARAGDLAVGDRTTVQTPAPVDVSVVGIATFGGTDGLGETTFTAFTLEGAEANVTRQAGLVTTVLARAEPGVPSDVLRERVAAALPAGVEAITGQDLAAERIDEIATGFLDMLRMFLVVFAGVALVVATLSINNTFTITVAQRTRELALLRAVGASRRQVRAVVAIEAVIVGGLAAVVGAFAGLGVAGLLKGMFDAFGFALPAGGLVVRPASLIIGAVVGLVVTFVAAQLPARRASRVAPVEAMRATSAEAAQLGRARVWVGTALAGGGAVLSVLAAATGTVLFAAVGSLALVTGVLLTAAVVVRPITSVAGAVLGRLRGSSGVLASQNARRNPRRTAATSTALVVGVAVVTLFTVFTASLRATLDEGVGQDLRADLAVSTPAFGGAQLGPDLAVTLGKLPQVATAVGLGQGAVLVDGEPATVTTTEPSRLSEVARVEPVEGSLEDVGADGIAISAAKADEAGWAVGTPLTLTFNDGASEAVEVRAVYGDNDLLGGVVVPSELWTAHTAQASDRSVLVALRPGADLDDARRAITPIAERFGGDVQDQAEFAAATTAGLDMLLGIIYVLLGLAVLIALLGIGNTLSLVTYERRHEIGLLRAVGQTRRQVRSVLRLESVIVASLGTIVGLGLGGFLGWVLFATVADDASTGPASFSLPVGRLAVVALLGAFAGVLAARRPARRAARLPVLDALRVS